MIRGDICLVGMADANAFVITADIGGQAIDSTKIKNYMGYVFITGPELSQNRGEIAIQADCANSRSGVFAAGDVTNAYGKRIIMARRLSVRWFGFALGGCQCDCLRGMRI